MIFHSLITLHSLVYNITFVQEDRPGIREATRSLEPATTRCNALSLLLFWVALSALLGTGISLRTAVIMGTRPTLRNDGTLFQQPQIH